MSEDKILPESEDKTLPELKLEPGLQKMFVNCYTDHLLSHAPTVVFGRKCLDYWQYSDLNALLHFVS